MEAGSMQLRAWLEEVISANEALEARIEALEASAAAADHERAALEGWVRGSVQEQAAASTRLASFQVGNLHLECSKGDTSMATGLEILGLVSSML